MPVLGWRLERDADVSCFSLYSVTCVKQQHSLYLAVSSSWLTAKHVSLRRWQEKFKFSLVRMGKKLKWNDVREAYEASHSELIAKAFVPWSELWVSKKRVWSIQRYLLMSDSSNEVNFVWISNGRNLSAPLGRSKKDLFLVKLLRRK